MTKTFKEVIAGIRTAIYGREVREDIAQMGEYVEQFANTATTKASEAASSASEAKASQTAAKTSETNAANSQKAAASSASSAATSAANAATSESNAATSEANALRYSQEAGAKASTDKTLSIADAPADAKAVGDTLDSIMLMLVTGNLTFGLYTSTGGVLCASDNSTLTANKTL